MLRIPRFSDQVYSIGLPPLRKPASKCCRFGKPRRQKFATRIKRVRNRQEHPFRHWPYLWRLSQAWKLLGQVLDNAE